MGLASETAQRRELARTAHHHSSRARRADGGQGAQAEQGRARQAGRAAGRGGGQQAHVHRRLDEEREEVGPHHKGGGAVREGAPSMHHGARARVASLGASRAVASPAGASAKHHASGRRARPSPSAQRMRAMGRRSWQATARAARARARPAAHDRHTPCASSFRAARRVLQGIEAGRLLPRPQVQGQARQGDADQVARGGGEARAGALAARLLPPLAAHHPRARPPMGARAAQRAV